jgi:protein phosphatase PTC2/3
MNVNQPKERENEVWPKCSFFGVYDGHGGSSCSDFLRDNLHHFVIKHKDFPTNPKIAIAEGFN